MEILSMLKSRQIEMRLLVLLLALTLGCLGPSEVEVQEISAVTSNPEAYREETVNFNATVVQMSPYQQGALFLLRDDSGEITAIYTGGIMTVDIGYKAIFSGNIIQDPSFGAHGSGVLLSVTGIRDVIPGKLEVVPPSIPTPISGPPTIAEIKGNLQVFSQQETIAISGKITQSQNAGGYTYVEIDDGTDSMWVAIPESEVAIGQEVRAEGILMINFPSKTLGRTFDVILFCTGLEPIQAPVPEVISVPKAEGGYTVEEIYSNRDNLKNSLVKIRGVAVRVIENIMNMTWIHLQDGSGDPAAKTNDLVVTYRGDQKINAGDEIIVTGLLAVDVDYGAGYFFEAIVEDAEIEKV
jgi:hypothetical protein